MNTVKRIAKNTAVLTTARIISMIFSLVLTALIARHLGDINFGKYSFAFAFTSLFVILSNFGLHTLTLREIARDKKLATKYLGNIFSIKIILSIVVFVLIVVTINLLNYPSDTKLAVYIMSLYIIMTSFIQFHISIFRAFEQMEYEALTTVLGRVVLVSLGLIVLFLGGGLIAIILVFFIGAIFEVVFTLFLLTSHFVKFRLQWDLKFWRHLMKKALPFGLAGIFGVIYFRIDIVMLSAMKGDAVVGWYNAAYRLLEGVEFIPALFAVSLFPVLSKFFVSSPDSLKHYYNKSVEYLLFLAIPLAIGTTILADKIILFLYGIEYANSIIALKILIWAVFFIFLNYTLGTVLISINREKLGLLNGGVAVLLNIGLNFLLIPRLSYVGASISTVITEASLFIISFCFISKYLSSLSLHKLIIRPLIASLVMGCAIFCLRNLNLFILIFLGIAVYGGMLYFMVSHEDRELFRKLLHNKA